jgi:hypothetical protein
MKFGDIVVNDWAGPRNPSKVMMLVHQGKTTTCLDIKGRKHTFDRDNKLRKIGAVDLSEWAKLIEEASE